MLVVQTIDKAFWETHVQDRPPRHKIFFILWTKDFVSEVCGFCLTHPVFCKLKKILTIIYTKSKNQ